ncbi:MAG: helix-turn-helix domain-containing protein [Dehalococcoidia bacterium]|nr:helix-turn-helix domain-containing protein [Dehalococcoidia bacterium]
MNELGEWLQRAREARGLTLEDAERDTRISRRYLQALETGELDVIPAPVYARGFLRSYAQYLGLDPQEAMARYPRDDGPPGIQSAPRPQAAPRQQRQAPPQQQQRAQAPRRGVVGAEELDEDQEPPAAAGRPSWRRPGPAREARQPLDPQAGSSEPIPLQRQANAPASYPEDNHEPMIGVDIGVPAPARRIAADPAAQTRSMAVAVVAIIAVVGILGLAFMISSLGGDDGAADPVPPGGDAADVSGNGDAAGSEGDGGDDSSIVDAPTATPEPEATGDEGVVPDVTGETEEDAIAAIESAGLVPNVRMNPDESPAGTVVTQSPGPGTQLEPGEPVTIVVSEGPS